MLKGAMRSILARLINGSETGSEVFLKDSKLYRCFPRLVSYRCDIPEAADMSSIRHEARRCHSCVKSTVKFKDMTQGRRSTSWLLSGTTDTRRKVKSLEETAAW